MTATVSYAVYDVETGEVVHLHIEPAERNTSPEEVLALADPGRTRNLAVVQPPVESMPAAPSRVVEGELQAAGEAAGGFGGGGMAGGVVEPDVERRYEPQPRGTRTGG